VITGDPVVKKPLAASARKPSLTIVLSLFFRALAMLTVKVRVILEPAGR